MAELREASTASPSLDRRIRGWLGRRRSTPVYAARHVRFEGVTRSWRAMQREGLPLLAVLTVLLLWVGAAVVLFFERDEEGGTITSLGEALWYGIVTMTTVGYGDRTPLTLGGRLVGVLLMLGGMSVLSLVTATFASVLVAQRLREGRGLATVRWHGHILVCGWNPYGDRVLEGLAAAHGAHRLQVVLVSDLAEDLASEVLGRHPGLDLQLVRGDPGSEATLERANVTGASAAIVLTDSVQSPTAASDERTALVCLALKSMKPDLRVTVEAINLRSEPHLKRAGADDIVISGEFNGFLLSSAALSTGVAAVVRDILSVGGQELQRRSIPPELVGHTFAELLDDLRRRDGFLTLAVVTEHRGLTLEDLLTDDYSLIDVFIKNQFDVAHREYLRFEEGGVRVLVNPPDSYLVGPDDTAIGISRRS